MTTFPRTPRTLRAGLVLIDPASGTVRRVITLQYTPDTLNRSLAVQGAGGESGDRSQALRLKGPPVETITLEAEIDAADQLEFPAQNPAAVQLGIAPQLAALETIVYPASDALETNRRLAAQGTLEIAPMEAPLVLFVWSKNRVVPVRITEFSIVEEAFDPALNPIRAKVSLGLRVLNVDDLGFEHRGASIYFAYQRQKEALAQRDRGGTLSDLGIRSLS